MKELMPTSEFYIGILDSTPHLISVLNEQGQVRYVNKPFRSLVRCEDSEEGSRPSLLSLVHPTDRNLVHTALKQAVGQEQVVLAPFRLKGKGGEWHWVEGQLVNRLQTEPLQGLVLTLCANSIKTEPRPDNICHSISYRSLFHNHPDVIFALDLNGYITETNKSDFQATHFSADEIIGHHFSEFIPRDLLPEAEKFLEKVVSGSPQSTETRIFNKHGHLIDMNIVGMPLSIDGVIQGVQCIAKDITLKKKQDRQLELLSLVTNQTINGVVLMDCKGNVEWVNQSFTRLTGFSFAEAAGKSMLELLTGPTTNAEVFTLLENAMAKPEAVACEIQFHKKSGEDIWFSIEMNPLRDEHGNLLKLVCTQMDITEQKKSQIELLALAKDLYVHNRDLQQSTYIISHNLRAPVANAVGLANLISKLDEGNPLYRPSLSKLKTSVLQIDTILKDINLILSIRDNQDMVSKEEVRVQDVWRQAVQNLEEPLHQCNGEAVLEVDPLFTLVTKKAYLHSIFYNLLSNAIKYRSRERNLRVKARCYQDAEGRTVISFEDNGSGMDLQKVEKHLFKLYKRFHSYGEGRGIGLYLVKTHVEALDGHIEVDSQVNVGTRFVIYLN